MALKILSYPKNKNAQKALIAAQFVGAEIEEPAFEWGVTNKSEEFSKLTPIGKVPVLVTPKGSLFESNAIARYVARLKASNLFGTTEFEQGQVDQWIDFASNELGMHFMKWAGAVCGFGEYKEEDISKLRSEAERGLAALEQALSTSSTDLRLVGEYITLADIVTVCELIVPWQCIMSADFMKPYPTVDKYVADLAKVPQFQVVFGDVSQAAETPTGPLPPEKNPFIAKQDKDDDGEDVEKHSKRAKTNAEAPKA